MIQTYKHKYTKCMKNTWQMLLWNNFYRMKRSNCLIRNFILSLVCNSSYPSNNHWPTCLLNGSLWRSQYIKSTRAFQQQYHHSHHCSIVSFKAFFTKYIVYISFSLCPCWKVTLLLKPQQLWHIFTLVLKTPVTLSVFS